MKTSNEPRHENFCRLVDEYGGDAAFARVIDRSEAQVWQLRTRSPDSKTGKPKNVGAALARHIEQCADRPRGWMDNDHARGPQGLTPEQQRALEAYSRMPAAIQRAYAGDDAPGKATRGRKRA